MFSFFKKKHPIAEFLINVFGFYPKNIYLFELAFIHKSASLYHNKNFSLNNERLEFLGDAVLNIIVGEYLYYEFPNENEGFLTNLRSKIVNRNTLNEIAYHLNIQQCMVTQQEHSHLNSKIYGNTLEALIGAIFIDQGYNKAHKIVLEKIILPHIDIPSLILNDTNYKGQILDWIQKKHYQLEFKNYETILQNNQQGYISELYINKQLYGTGKGISKKNAEQEASKQALIKIGILKQE
ncbi:MAG: ribonuclease III [Bacteroidales bacterium]|nr:ribonuclease III [Bacteroidales bacterium]